MWIPEPDIHDGIFLSGWVPLYCKLNDSHGVSPSWVKSIMLYICVVFENGGSSPWIERDAPQRLRRVLISPPDIWFLQNKKSVTSIRNQFAYGDQSSGPFDSDSRGEGGVLGGKLLPFLLQIRPMSRKVNVNVLEFSIQHKLTYHKV